MVFPIKDDWKLTTDFKEMRPLSVPAESRTHPHAAWDLAMPEGTRIYSPEDGKLFVLLQFRNRFKSHNLYWPSRHWFAFSNYFYDVFGGLIIVEGESGFTHVFAHINARDICAYCAENMTMTEMTEERGHPGAYICVFSNLRIAEHIEDGQVIGKSGNSGFSTGPHIHYEIHKKKEWVTWADRPDPKELWPAEWRKHYKDLK